MRYEDLSLSAILTSSGKDLACIFFMTWLRYILTVASLAPSSAATCLLKINREKVLASLNKTCPSPDLVKRVDFEQISGWISSRSNARNVARSSSRQNGSGTESPQGVATSVSWWGAG